MTGILLSYGSSTRQGRLPNLTTRNLIAEPSATEVEKSLILLNRPGLDSFVTAGDGPIRGVFQRKGLFSDDAIVLSAQTVDRVSTSAVVTALTGEVPGWSRVDMDGGQNTEDTPVDEVRIATGDALYLVTSSTVAADPLPDDVGAQSIMFNNGLWVAAIKDTGRALIKLPGEPWAMLDSVVAEKSPDNLEAVRPLGDLFIFLGAASVEGWQQTGTADPPIRRVPGQSFPIGCLSRDAAKVVGTSLLFVGSDFTVYEYSTYPQAISDFGISEQIRLTEPSKIRAWSFNTDQHTYYILRLGNRSTWVFDLVSRKWFNWSSYGEDYFKPHLGTQVGGMALAASDEDGTIWKVDADALTDAGVGIERRFTGYVPLKGGWAIIDSVSLHCAVGVGLVSGQGVEPKVGMRFSTDQGKTWSDWMFEDLGEMGQYETRVIWRRLGRVDAPGIFFEWIVTDPVEVRVSDARLNED